MLEYQLLQHFIAVARKGSFTEAAEDVHACRSVVTRSIKRLEDKVGVRLFDRTTRSVKLTAAGAALFHDVDAIGDHVAVALSKARRIGQGTDASLRIGLCSSAHSMIAPVAQAIAAFRVACPELEVKTTTVPRNLMGEALRSSQVDFGIFTLNRGDCKDLAWRVLASSPMKLWVPPSWGVAEAAVKLERFRDKHWVLTSPNVGPDMLDMQLALCRSAGFTPKEVSYNDDVLNGVMMRVCEQGAVFIHTWDAPADDPAVKSIEGLPPYCSSEIVIAWAEGAMCDSMRNFVDLVFAAGTAEGGFPPIASVFGGLPQTNQPDRKGLAVP